jgi:hypothetical protein
MRHVAVAVTLVRAHFTHLGARRTDRGNGGAAACHGGGGRPADVSAIEVEANAVEEHLDVGFLQACTCAVVTCLRANVASIDAFLMVLLHGLPPGEVKKKLAKGATFIPHTSSVLPLAPGAI